MSARSGEISGVRWPPPVPFDPARSQIVEPTPEPCPRCGSTTKAVCPSKGQTA